MKLYFFLLIIVLLTHCSKPKTVLICGDHVCVNKSEAEKYFEENLSIEVKIIDNNNKKQADLVQLNLKNEQNGKRSVNILSKKNTNNKIKILSDKEVIEIKKNLKNRKKKKNIAKKKPKKLFNEKNSSKNFKKNKILNDNIGNLGVNKKHNNVVDVCTILKNCSIDEISKYLLNEGKKKKFPDLTTKQ